MTKNKNQRERTFSVIDAREASDDQLEIHRDFLVTLADFCRTVNFMEGIVFFFCCGGTSSLFD